MSKKLLGANNSTKEVEPSSVEKEKSTLEKLQNIYEAQDKKLGKSLNYDGDPTLKETRDQLYDLLASGSHDYVLDYTKFHISDAIHGFNTSNPVDKGEFELSKKIENYFSYTANTDKLNTPEGTEKRIKRLMVGYDLSMRGILPISFNTLDKIGKQDINYEELAAIPEDNKKELRDMVKNFEDFVYKNSKHLVIQKASIGAGLGILAGMYSGLILGGITAGAYGAVGGAVAGCIAGPIAGGVIGVVNGVKARKGLIQELNQSEQKINQEIGILGQKIDVENDSPEVQKIKTEYKNSHPKAVDLANIKSSKKLPQDVKEVQNAKPKPIIKCENLIEKLKNLPKQKSNELGLEH